MSRCLGVAFFFGLSARPGFSSLGAIVPSRVQWLGNNNMTPAVTNREPAKARPGFLTLDYRTHIIEVLVGVLTCVPLALCVCLPSTHSSPTAPRSFQDPRFLTDCVPYLAYYESPAEQNLPRDDHSRHIIG